MITRLKICGITSLADAQIAVELGVDILGFNFYSRSPRYIDPDECRSIISALPFFVTPVGILVQPTRKDVETILKKTRVRVLQIVEPRDFEDFYHIPVPVIWVRQMDSSGVLDGHFRGANMVLLDTFSPNTYGGTGKCWDWNILPAAFPREKLVLAGGINPGNIREALEKVHPAIIDVASGAEIYPGKKDPQKIKQLVEAIRYFNQKQIKLNF